jgi:serum/glucocorticoid-regulated kinase 2
MARLRDEDSSPTSSKNSTSTMNSLGDEDFSFNMEERADAYMHNSVPSMEIDKENAHIMHGGREKSSTLYCKDRNSQEITLDDFTVRKVIGQGSFGKVFMVQQKTTGQIYAMKSIRKDVVIDAEQLENLRLEKHIMLCVEHPFIINMEYVFQKEHRIYFLMDFIRGGEMYRVLQQSKRLPES